MSAEAIGKTTIYVDGKQAEDEIKRLNTVIDKYTKLMDQARKANDLAGFEKYKKEVTSAKKELREYKTVVYDVTKVLNNLSGTSYNVLIKVQRQLEREIKKMNKNTKEEIKLYNEKKLQLKKVKDETKKLRMEMNGYTKTVNKLKTGLSKLMAAFGITTGIYTAINAIRHAITVTKEFGKALSSLSAITGIQGSELDYFREKAIEYSNDTLKSANEILKAFEMIGSIRPELLKDKEALAEVTKNAIILSEATGGKLGLKEAAEATAGTLNQFGIEAKNSADVINALAAGSKVGAANVVNITKSTQKFGAVADVLNIKLETSIGLVETLAEKQILGEEAGTKLRNILIKLQEDQENYKNGVFDVNLALDNLANSNKSVTELTKQFGKENVIAAQILIKNREKVIKYTEAVTGTNTALEQQNIQNNNLDAALKQLNNSWDSLILKISGANSGLTSFIKSIKWIIDIAQQDLYDVDNPFDDINDSLKTNQLLLEEAKKRYKNLSKYATENEREAIKREIAFYQAAVDRINNHMSKVQSDQIKKMKKYKENVSKLSIEALNELIKKEKKIIENADKSTSEYEIKQAKKRLEILLQIEQRKLEILKRQKEEEGEAASKQNQENITSYFEEDFNTWLENIDKNHQKKLQKLFEIKKQENDILKQYEEEADEYDSDINESPELQKAMNLAKRQREIWEQSYEGRKRKLEEMLAAGFITEKEYHQRVYQLDIEFASKRIEVISNFLDAASQALNAYSLFYEAQKNKELKAAEGNEKKQEEIRQKYATKEKKISIAQAAIRGAIAIMNVWAHNSMTYPAAAIYNGIMSAVIAATTAAQISLINSQQFAKGNFINVVGADDGKLYNAAIGNNRSRIVSTPTYEPGLGLVGEAGPELVFSSPDTQKIINTPELVDAIRMTIGPSPQFASGNSTEIIRETKTETKTFTDPALMEMLAKINQKLSEPAKAVLVANEDYIRTHKQVSDEYDDFQKTVSL